jgi:hypothetical protein
MSINIPILVDDNGTLVEFTRAAEAIDYLTAKVGTQMPAAARAMAESTEKADISLSNLTAKTTLFGMKSSDMTRITRGGLSGLSMGFMEAADGMAKLDTGATKAITTGSRLVSALTFGGPIAGLIAVAGIIGGELVGNMQKAEAEAKAVTTAVAKPFDELKAKIQELISLQGLAALAKTIGVSEEALTKYAGSTWAANQNVQALNNNQASAAIAAQQLADVQAKLNDKTSEYNRIVQTQGLAAALSMEYKPLRVEIDSLTNQADKLRAALNKMTAASIEGGSAIKDIVNPLAELDPKLEANNARWETQAFLVDRSREKLSLLASREMKEMAAAQDIQAYLFEKDKLATLNYVAALEKLESAMKSVLSNAIDKALVITTVTDLDMMATAAGKYKNKWDELARQSDIIKRDGIGRLAEFPVLQAALERTGLSAEEFGIKFRDMSLFADPKNFNLVDWGIVTMDVENQFDQMLGKLNLTERGIKAVWNQLPEDKREALKKLGIANLDDATKVMLGEKPSHFDIVPADTFAANLNSIQDSILSAIPPEMKTTVFVTYTTESGGSMANSPSAAAGAGNFIGTGAPMASGWTGVLDRPTLFRGDAGEGVWFSGKDWQIPPPTATTTQAGPITIIVNGNKSPRETAREVGRELRRDSRR